MIDDLRVGKSMRYPSFTENGLKFSSASILLSIQRSFCYDGEKRAGSSQKPTLRYTLRLATRDKDSISTPICWRDGAALKSILDLVQQTQSVAL
jgi:hypothetical protein